MCLSKAIQYGTWPVMVALLFGDFLIKMHLVLILFWQYVNVTLAVSIIEHAHYN